MLNDTICAISTALKDGAISIVRMSGEDAFEIIKKISDVKEIMPNTIVYSHIHDNDEIVDEVLISFFGKGKSYTKEDMVEINCHGGVYVTRLILNILLKNGCRLAEAGEFTRRAYLNGRIDLAEADSINDLIKAQSAIQARSAIRGLNGSVERLIMPLMDEMRDVISMIEVNIDYPEYEDEKQMSNDVIRPYVRKWIKAAEETSGRAFLITPKYRNSARIISGIPRMIVIYRVEILFRILIWQSCMIQTTIPRITAMITPKIAIRSVYLNPPSSSGRYFPNILK